MSNKIIILIDDEQTVYKNEADILKNENFTLIITHSSSKYLTTSAFSNNVIGMIVRASIEVDQKLISMLPFLKIIFVTGAGFNKVDIDFATKQKIIVAYAGDYCAQEVAEHIIAMIFALEKNLAWYDRKVKQGYWKITPPYPTKKILGKNIGIIGIGHIGKALISLSLGVGIKVFAHDPYVEKTIFNKLGASPCGLDELLTISDYISVNLPLTKETYKLFSESLFLKMKKGVIFINTCRGLVVDEKALFNAIKSGHIRAIGLDVLQEEPPRRDNPFLELENSILTPHIGYQSVESVQEVKKRAVKEIVGVFKGIKPRFLANPEVWDELR